MRVRSVVVALVIVACAHARVTAPLDREFVLPFGQTATIENTDVSITFELVTEDSRCPSNVACVWAGNARIVLAMSARGSRDTLPLNSTLDPKEAVRAGYRVRFVGLTPHPVAGRTTTAEEYRATLFVTAK